jgi:hypothetical protein
MSVLRQREVRRSKVRRLTVAELRHLRGLLEDEAREGSYYGPKDQHYARQVRLVDWIDEQLAELESPF